MKPGPRPKHPRPEPALPGDEAPRPSSDLAPDAFDTGIPLCERPSPPTGSTKRAQWLRDLGVSIAAQRQARGISQGDLGELLSISQGMVSRIERGDPTHNPDSRDLALYAQALGCEIRDLTGGGF